MTRNESNHALLYNIWKGTRRIFRLPPWLAVLACMPAFVLVALVLARDAPSSAVVLFVYLWSAWALITTLASLAYPLVSWVQDASCHPQVRKRQADIWLRLLPGLASSLIYAGINLYTGLSQHAFWFLTLGAYYSLLGLMRFLLLKTVRAQNRDLPVQRRLCRQMGWLLVVMDWVLTGVVVLALTENRSFTYAGSLIYAVAFYTFYAVIAALVNLLKNRKSHSPLQRALRTLNLSAALVSLLALETAMVCRFGAGQPEVSRILTAMTGALTCLAVLILAFLLLRQDSRRACIERRLEP